VITYIVHTVSATVRASPIYWQIVLYVGIAALFLVAVRIFLPKIFKKKERQETSSQNTRQTVPGNISITNEQKELLAFYEGQKEDWRNNLRLNIKSIKLGVDNQVPKIIFGMEMINYLPVDVKLVKVVKSSGSVGAGSFGHCDLPSFPETIDEKAGKCFEKQFELTMAVGGTGVPAFLKPLLLNRGQRLQWILKGEWYIEIFGKTELWATQSYQITHDQIIEGFYAKGN